MNSSCEYSQSDASYVLGALSPAERRVFEGHLDGCAQCSRSIRDLAGLQGLLARVDPEVFDEVPDAEPVPDTLLLRLSAAVRRGEHRRTWVTAGIAACAAAVITVGGVLALDRPDGSPVHTVTTAAARPMTTVGNDPMTARLALTSVAWGTRIDLSCSYPQWHGRYEAGASYALVVHTTDGRSKRVATWLALPGRSMQLTAATASSAPDIASVVVTTDDGTPVLALSN